MRNIQLEVGEYYHIYNRGVDKRQIFVSEDDYRYFYNCLYLFNDSNYSNAHGDREMNEILLASSDRSKLFRDPFVKIISYNLRNNHFHIFLEQLKENGISIFLHKITMAYTKRFNKKNKRSGVLFESGFKASVIVEDAYFCHMIRYIHLNSLDQYFSEWRQGLIMDWDSALEILKKDKWSSNGYYLGNKQVLPIIEADVFPSFYSDLEEYTRFIKSWTDRSALPVSLGDTEFEVSPSDTEPAI